MRLRAFLQRKPHPLLMDPHPQLCAARISCVLPPPSSCPSASTEALLPTPLAHRSSPSLVSVLSVLSVL